MKLARKVWKWITGNLRWILAGLAALGIVVGGVIGHLNVRQENKTLREALRNQEKQSSESEEREVETVTETVYVETYDAKTGMLLRKTRTELKHVKEENDRLRKKSTKVPAISLPSGAGGKGMALYPLGGFVMATPAGELGGGLKWRLIPRLALPFVPDLSLSVGAGYHRDAITGLVLMDLHRR
jgi:hypothetical protein